MVITITIPNQEELSKKLGVNKTGIAQLFHTTNVFRHMLPYMPMLTGMFATKQTRVVGTTKIVTRADQAYYLYFGRRMVNAKTGKGPMYIEGVGYRWRRGSVLVPTSQPLHYTTTFHPLAGPYWDRRMLVADGNKIADELKEFIKRLV